MPNVNDDEMQNVVHAYYQAWAAQDKPGAAALMANDMRHISVWGRWESAESYLEEFERLSEGLAAIEFIRELYGAGEAFVLFRVIMESGASFIGTDLLRIDEGLVSEIINVNTGDPTKLVELIT
jgi:ketosteroid isomerase-like protein